MALITDHWGLGVMTVLTAFVITAYIYMTRNFKYWKKRGILEVTPTPFLGNFAECLLLRKAPMHFLKELYDRAKGLPYIGFYIIDKPCLLIRDREIIKNIFMKDFNQFADRHSSACANDRLGCASLFLLKNPAWKIVRMKLTPFFTSGKLKKMFGLMMECANGLDAHLDSLKLDGEGRVMDVRDLTAKFTLNVISSTAYGLDVDSFKDPDHDFCKYGRMMFHNDYTRGLELLAVFFIPSIARLTGATMFGKVTSAFLCKVFWKTIVQRMESGEKRDDLIDILIELKRNHGDQDIEGFKFDGDDLTAQAASFFSAGFDTSAMPMAFALYELALQPEIQNALRKEILEALDDTGGKITYDMILSLPYLDMVVAETLRMYPPLAFLNREATQTYKIPDFDLTLEKGTPVFVSMLGLHYDPEYFPDPGRFDPERFSEVNKRDIPSCVYVPFGEGSHACIGTRFGLLQVKLALIKILSKVEVSPCEKTLIPMVIDPVISMTSPLDGVIYLNMRKINTTANLIE